MKKNSMLIVALLVLLSALQSQAKDHTPKNIFFEHWRHYDAQGIPCVNCHKNQTEGVFSYPDHKVCESCHPKGKLNDYSDAKTENCQKCHPQDASASSPLLSKISRTERTFFHSKKIAELCEVCHGPMLEDAIAMGELIKYPAERQRIRRRAHRFHNTNECNNCHHNMSLENPPKNHGTNWGTEHKVIAPEFNCRICHTKSSFCKNCHEDFY